MKYHNMSAIRAFTREDEKAEFLFFYLAYKENNDKFTKTATIANIFTSHKCEFDRNKLTPFLKKLESLELGKFEQRWKGKSGFRWNVNTKEFFSDLYNG